MVEIDAGGASCAIIDDGTVRCWGTLGWMLGAGSDDPSATPVQVVGLDDAVDIYVGEGHACALRSTGAVRCWGVSLFETLGDGSTSMSNVPIDVVGVSDGTALYGTQDSTCAASASGGYRCWGNALPITPDNQSTSHTTATAFDHRESRRCELRADGLAWCRGFNSAGQLGDGTQDTRSEWAPVRSRTEP